MKLQHFPVIGALIIALTSVGAQASEGISGWGPWRFGMTHEEAAIAIGRRGQFFDGELRLTHEIGGQRWVAIASFSEPRYGGIGLIRLGTKDDLTNSQCRSLYDLALSRLRSKHEGGQSFSSPAKKGASFPESTEGVVFMKEDSSFIHLVLKRYGKELKECALEVTYSPPTVAPIADF